jgi:hypothetical protein
MLTIVDGDATVLDGTRRLAAAEGLRVGPGAIVETGAGTGLLRIEWPDGHMLDLGPETRVMVSPPGAAARDKTGTAVYLLSGWTKLSSGAASNIGGLLAPGLELAPFTGVAVALVTATETMVFAEAGALQLLERGSKTPARFSLKGGESYFRMGSGVAAVSPRAPSEVMQRIPRAFRDTLPLRWNRFKDQDGPGAALPAPSYAELAPWLTAEPALRRDFPRRFAARAREPAFRDALIAHLAAHPEWEPVLFPPPPPKPDTSPR